MNRSPRDTQPVYTRQQWVRAVNLSGFLGWLCIALPLTAGTNSLGISGVLGLLLWAAAIGLPIAFAASWLITAPILKRIMHRKITWIGAAVWGAGVTSCIALVSIIIGRTVGWLHWLDQSSGSQIGGGDYIRSINGILTPYGWLQLAERTALFIVVGTGIALIVRALVGPGRTEK